MMRPTLRLLLASVKPARYLEAGAPTGLTGLRTNPSPRPTLLYLYASTLERLQGVPETSLYRQSVEAVTRQRMALVEAAKPAGYDEWRARAAALLERNPKPLDPTAGTSLADGGRAAARTRDGRVFVLRRDSPAKHSDERVLEWDGEVEAREDAADFAERMEEDSSGAEGMEWENEPNLTAEQIEELENKIGAGLIEEVIHVAEGELSLVDTMIEAKVWESLEEKPKEGQWQYFERKE